MVFALVMPIAHADDSAITLTNWEDFTSASFSLGFTFSPTVSIDVTSLGSFFPADATDQHGVSLWDSSQNLLASATITGDDGATDDFQFAPIASIELLAGQTYTVSGFTSGDDYAIANNGSDGTPGDGFNVGPDIAYMDHVEIACNGPGACFPTTDYGQSFADFGANFTYTTTPEPSTFLMLGSGLVGLAGLVRRKFARR